METTIVEQVIYNRLFRDNGKEHGCYYLGF